MAILLYSIGVQDGVVLYSGVKDYSIIVRIQLGRGVSNLTTEANTLNR